MELETFFTAGEQTKLFLISCLLGIPVGIAFDVFRVIRIALPHNKFIVALEDILFMLLYASFIVSFSVIASRGEFRFFYIAGNALGFITYYLTIGNILVKAFQKIFSLIHKILKPILIKLSTPFKKLFVLICQKFNGFFIENPKKKFFNKKKTK